MLVSHFNVSTTKQWEEPEGEEAEEVVMTTEKNPMIGDNIGIIKKRRPRKGHETSEELLLKGKRGRSRHDQESGEEARYGEEEISTPELEVPDTRALGANEISSGLSLLGKTAEGDGYTYLKMTCTGKGLTNVLAIKNFKHLQFVDVSNNKLDLPSLQPITELPYLILLHADKNLLTSAALKRCKYLQVLILNENQLTSVHDVYQPELCTLEVGKNKIRHIAFKGRMPHIRCLDFRYNYIEDISDLHFIHLDSLYLAGNMIKSLVGIGRLVNLRILHLRFNPIKTLDGLDGTLTKLSYLNLRNCMIKTLLQVKKLRALTGLETLVMKGCPYLGGTGQEEVETAVEEEDHDTRLEVLAALPRLKRFNKNVVTPEERDEAKELMMQWLQDGEDDEEEEEEVVEEEERED